VTRRPARLALLLLGVLVLCGACRMRLDVDVTVDEDGGGVVAVVLAVDADALAKVGGDLAAVVDLARLTREGWSVVGPARVDDGDTELRLEHTFADPAEGERVLATLSGEDGPLSRFRIGHDEGFWRDRWTFAGQADFSKGPGSPAVRDASVADLADQLGSSLDRLIQVRVRVRLPGDVSSNATTQAANGAVWAIGLSDGAVDLSATGTRSHPWGPLLVIGGGVLVVVLLVTGLVRLAMLRTDGRR
jgi:hypothetical protein